MASGNSVLAVGKRTPPRQMLLTTTEIKPDTTVMAGRQEGYE
jgi:hypothetical protein